MVDLAQRQTVYALRPKSGRRSNKGVQVSGGRWSDWDLAIFQERLFPLPTDSQAPVS